MKGNRGGQPFVEVAWIRWTVSVAGVLGIAIVAATGGAYAQQVGACGDGLLCNIPGCTSGPNGSLEECDRGANNSDSEPDGCRTSCALASCGDGVVDSGEVCDDGNTAPGDDCPADCRRCPSSAQQSCVNTINKRAAKVAATQGKENLGCVKDATKGKLTATADECLLLDGKGKVEKAAQKTVSDAAAKCGSQAEPDFGYTDAEEANEVAIEEERAFMNDLFGEEIDAAISTSSPGRCQTKIVQRAEKIIATKWKEFLRCKKSDLKDGAVCSGTDLEGCLDVVRDDPKGKVQKTVDRLEADVAQQCAGVDFASAFPGLCAEVGDFAACVDEQAECRFCRMVNGVDGLDGDCDLFDDGVANGTCGGVPPTPTPTPLPTFTPTLLPTPTIMCGASPLLVTVSPDPIKVPYGQNTTVTASATPLNGQYRNWTVTSSELDVELAFLQQPTCMNQPSCSALINAPEVDLPAPNVPLKVCGTAEVEVSFRCASSGQDATDTARVEVGCGSKSAAECEAVCSREDVQGQCGTPCDLAGVTPPPYQATIGSCWKTNVNGTDYCYWDHKSQNAPGLGSLCCPNRCFGGAFVVWGQGVGVYACTAIERCDDNPEFAGSECVDVTGTFSQ